MDLEQLFGASKQWQRDQQPDVHRRIADDRVDAAVNRQLHERRGRQRQLARSHRQTFDEMDEEALQRRVLRDRRSARRDRLRRHSDRDVRERANRARLVRDVQQHQRHCELPIVVGRVGRLRTRAFRAR